jgi:ATP synthase protein I
MKGDDARSERGSMSGGTSEDDLSGRLDRLGSRLDARRVNADAKAPGRGETSDPSAYAKAFRMSSEFVAGIVVGGGVGWAVDRALGISPWGLIVFLLLGFAAGVFNVIRVAGLPAPGSHPASDRKSQSPDGSPAIRESERR